MAVDAGIRFLYQWGPVALDVVTVGKLQNIPGTKGNAITAAFASFLNNVYDAPGNLNFGRIERGPPIFHGYLSFKSVSKVCSLFPANSRRLRSGLAPTTPDAVHVLWELNINGKVESKSSDSIPLRSIFLRLSCFFGEGMEYHQT
jgi:hypothetical protein